nr:MAG TPA: Lower collar protein [Caudoviricetes sp.]
MAVYTTKVKDICENQYIMNHPDYNEDDLNNTILLCKDTHKNIFNFDYPLADELKTDFETTFLMHYYFREIGQETVGVWKHYIAEHLYMVADTYNQLYKSINLDYDILNPLHYTENESVNLGETTSNNRDSNTNANSSEHSKTNDTGNTIVNNTTTNTNSGNNTMVHKDLRTPQGNLTDFLDGKYMSGATHDYGNTTANGNTTIDNNEDRNNTSETDSDNDSTTKTTETQNGNRNQTTIRERTITGKSDNVSQAQLILDYRETVLNLINQLVSEFEDNFMMIYDDFDNNRGVFNNMILGGYFNGRF